MEKFDPNKTYGTLPARSLKVGDKVKNGKLYPATVWEVHGINRGQGLVSVSCEKGQGVFSFPYMWTHEDGTAITLQIPEFEPVAPAVLDAHALGYLGGERRHEASCVFGDCWCKPGSDGR